MMAKETWMQRQCQELEAGLRKKNCKNNRMEAYQLVKDLTPCHGRFKHLHLAMFGFWQFSYLNGTVSSPRYDVVNLVVMCSIWTVPLLFAAKTVTGEKST